MCARGVLLAQKFLVHFYPPFTNEVHNPGEIAYQIFKSISTKRIGGSSMNLLWYTLD